MARQIPAVPWPVRGIIAGFAGTAAMTALYSYLHRQHPGALGLTDAEGIGGKVGFDYDDTGLPGQILANIAHLPSLTPRQAGNTTLAIRWSYGSAFGISHVILRSRLGEPRATMIFGGALMTMTFTMFPLLGRTPPPWRWSAQTLATCLTTHAVYIGAAAVTDNVLARYQIQPR